MTLNLLFSLKFYAVTRKLFGITSSFVRGHLILLLARGAHAKRGWDHLTRWRDGITSSSRLGILRQDGLGILRQDHKRRLMTGVYHPDGVHEFLPFLGLPFPFLGGVLGGVAITIQAGAVDAPRA